MGSANASVHGKNFPEGLLYNQRQTGIERKIKTAELRAGGKRTLSPEETASIYDFGRMIGLSREEIDRLVDYALYASKKGKQQAWEVWKDNKNQFWEYYRESQQEIAHQLNDLYRKRRLMKQGEWMLNPYNSKMSLWGVLFAFVLRLSTHTSLEEIEKEIAYYKTARERLYQNISQFKRTSEKGIQSLKEYDFSLDGYLSAISQMYLSVDDAFFAVLDIPPERRWILTSDYRMVRVSDLLEQQRLEER